MKILLISHDFLPGLPGGIAFFLHNLCRHFNGDIQVLVPESGEWIDFDRQQNYCIHRRAIPTTSGTARRTIRLGPLFLARIIWLAAVQFALYLLHGYRLVRREKIDCVWLGHLYLAPLGWLLRWLTGRPYAVILYGSELQRYWHLSPAQWLIRAFLNRANFLIVISDFTRRQYLDRGVRADQTFVHIYPGVDVQRFHPDIDPEPIIRQHGLAGKAIILTVARLVEWKGQDTVIRAMPTILKSVPNAVYLMAGQGPNRATLEALATQLNVQDKVVFAGFVPDEELPLYYAAADVLVLVSREVQLVDASQGGRSTMPTEGFGMVYVEANATGRPVVGGSIGATSESIAPGVTGLLADTYDEQAVAAAVVRLITDRDLARQMGQAGRARAVREFTWENQVNRLRQQLAALNTTGKSA
jgi:phosphatidylinositol alpha-1,6-mannosyltransferase